jgi:hypothetical protein
MATWPAWAIEWYSFLCTVALLNLGLLDVEPVETVFVFNRYVKLLEGSCKNTTQWLIHH